LSDPPVSVLRMSVASSQPAGYFGKIPARGDFVAAGLPSSVVKAWDRIISAALAASRTALAGRWPDTWLEAPVWRFALPATMCGPDPLLGLWMPSIDKAGRHFPLMIAATCLGATPEQMARHGTAWLDAAEDAGRAAIADDLTPEQLTALISPPPDMSAEPDTGLPHDLHPRPGNGLWWTEGAPLVPPRSLCLDTMPDRATFVTMLDASHAAP
jgi:type VI secretion system protein ImpM